MTSPLTSLDEFLDVPDAQRDVTRVMRLLVSDARFLVLVAGEGAAAVVRAVSQSFSGAGVHALLIEASPTRVTALRPGAKTIESGEGFSVGDALRSALRQDPDVIALTSLDAATGPMAVQAMLTGHLLVVGVAVGSLDEALGVLLTGSEGLRTHVEPMVEVGLELAGAKLRRVRFKGKDVARIEGGCCEIDRAGLPTKRERVATHRASLASPLSERPAPQTSPRPAFLPVTGAAAGVRSTLAVSSALRPAGTAWPRCRACDRDLVHVVTLDRAELPAPYAAAGLVQLFLCYHGCETRDERAPGVLLEALDDAAMTSVDGPVHAAVSPGAIVDWVRVDEEPASVNAAAPPLSCDKLGGWPAWEQGEDWPVDDDGARFELLFQFVEGAPLDGGLSAGWDFEQAQLVPAVPPSRVLDPNLPRHVDGVLTGDAVGLVFVSRTSGRLAFRWQGS